MWKRVRVSLAAFFGRTRASDAATQAPGEPLPSLARPYDEVDSPPPAPSQQTVPGLAANLAEPSPLPAGSASEEPVAPTRVAPLEDAPQARKPADDLYDALAVGSSTQVSLADDEDVEDADEDDEDYDDDDYDEDELDTASRDTTRDRTYFGEETWGASPRHRTAAMDAERLTRYDLPPLADEAALATWLGIPLGRLRWYTRDRPADTSWHYVRYTIPKRGGGERLILAPKRELKALQRKLLAGLLARVPASSAAHGFVPGRSIVTNAAQHTGRQVVLKLDLKDFFPSVTYPRVRGLFISLGYSFPVAATLALLCTEYERQEFVRDTTSFFISVGPRHLVQGAPTSPALANLVAWRLDRRLLGLAAKHNFTYTRYADDLTFSGNDMEVAVRLRAQAERIVRDERFTVNAAKTRLVRRAGRQTVTGLVVNDAPGVRRERRRLLRAILHNASRTGIESQNRDGRKDFTAHLMGQIAFVHAANRRHAAPLRLQLRRIASKLGSPDEPGS